jgi:hypothetical protein
MKTKFVAAAAATVVASAVTITVVEAAPGISPSAARTTADAPIERVTYGWRGCSRFWGHRYWRHCHWGQRRCGGYPSWGHSRRWGHYHRA